MQKLLYKWWFRIIVILIPIVLMYLFNSLFPFGFLVSTILFCLLLTIISLLIQSSRAGSNFNFFGLQFDRFTIPDIIKGLLIVLLTNISFIIIGLIFGYNYNFHDNFYDYDYSTLAFYTLFIFVMAFNEEIVFRGVLFQSLRERFGDVFSIIVMSILFSVVHLNNPNISTLAAVNIVLAGVFLSILYITTESLWLPISFHFFWNLNQQVILGSKISGLKFDIEILHLTAIDNDLNWFFGGDFGTEEGLLTTIVITFLIFLSFKMNKRNPFIMATKFKVNYEESKLLES